MAAAAGPLYRLADYLDQHGRAHRASQIPPAEFWSAAAAHAAPGDQAALGDAAHARGLYRDAAQLHKNAAASGNPRAALYLSDPPACLRADPRPAHWAAAHAALDDPDAVASLLDSLRQAGAHEQAAALLARDPAAHAALDDPDGVARLLDSLREAGAHEQAAALAGPGRRPRRPRRPGAVASLLDSLREAGAHEQAAALAARDPAAHAALDDPDAVASLLDSLREAGAHEQAAALAARAAAHAALDDPAAVASLLDSLREAGAHEQAAALLARDPPPTPPSTTRPPWPSCWTACGRRARTSRPPRWPARAAAHASLDDPDGVAILLDSLRQAGAHEQAAALAARAAAHAALDDPDGVARLLDSLREAGAHEQAAALLARDPPPTPPSTTRTPWPGCWTACGRRARTSRPPRWPPGPPPTPPSTTRRRGQPAGQPAGGGRARAGRRAGRPGRRPRRPRRPGRRGPPAGQPAGGGRARAGRRAAGPRSRRPRRPRRPGRRGPPAGQPAGGGRARAGRRAAGPGSAAHAALDDPGAVARLLDSLREAGAHEQAAALPARDPPPTPPSTTRPAWPACWTACGRRARTSRPPRWPVGCRRPACSGSSSSRRPRGSVPFRTGGRRHPGRAMGLGRPGLMACPRPQGQAAPTQH